MKTLMTAMIATTILAAPAFAQPAPQQQGPIYNIQMDTKTVQKIIDWGQEKPYKDSSDVLGIIWQQVTQQDMARNQAAEKAFREQVEKDAKAKEAKPADADKK